MNWGRTLIATAATLTLVATATLAADNTQRTENMRIAAMWSESAVLGNWDKVAQYMTPDLKGHDWHDKRGDFQGMKDGFAGMAKMTKAVKLEVGPMRQYADGDYVINHYLTTVTTPNGVRKHTTVDILRFVNGKIAEHWISSQELPMMSANANGAF